MAMLALAGAPMPLADAELHVPRRAGLYAIAAPGAVWGELGLGTPPDGRPLYVGKSESDLLRRDLEYHFGDEPTTGWSSPRRSFAALLRDELELRGVPRRPENPSYFNCFGLARGGEARLGAWMRSRLLLAVWPRPNECPLELEPLERAIVRRLQPPINLTHVSHEWKREIKGKRKVMADEARAMGVRPPHLSTSAESGSSRPAPS
jgi:hypothetical protein